MPPIKAIPNGARTRSMARRLPPSSRTTATSSTTPAPESAAVTSLASTSTKPEPSGTATTFISPPTSTASTTSFTSTSSSTSARRTSLRLSTSNSSNVQAKARIQAALGSSALASGSRSNMKPRSLPNSQAGPSRRTVRAKSVPALPAPEPAASMPTLSASTSAALTLQAPTAPLHPVAAPAVSSDSSSSSISVAANEHAQKQRAPSRIPKRRIGTRRNPVPPTPGRSLASDVQVETGMKRKAEEDLEDRKRPRVESQSSTLASTTPTRSPPVSTSAIMARAPSLNLDQIDGLPPANDIVLVERPQVETKDAAPESSMDLDLDLSGSTTPRLSPSAVASTTPKFSPPAVVPFPADTSASTTTPSPFMAPVAQSAPTTAPQPPPEAAGMVTPKSRILRHIGIKLPTPARDILRAGATMADAAAAVVIPRPPTPPRVADRTPENDYPPLSTASTPATPEHSSFADRISTLKANHITRSPNSRPPVLSIITQGLLDGFGPRRSLPGEDDPFFVRKPPPMPSPGSRPPMPPPPMICVFDPDDVVVDQVGVVDGMEVDEKEAATPVAEESSVVEAASESVQPVDTNAVLKEAPHVSPPQAETTPTLPAEAPSGDSQQGLTSEPMDVDTTVVETQRPTTPVNSTAPESTSSTPEGPASTPTGPRQFSGGLPPRRPSTRPTELGIVGPSRPSGPDSRRKASYPASLGSGPLRHQTTRVVSNPVPPPSITDDQEQDEPTSPRSVSEPTRGATANVRTPPPSRPPSRMSMSMSSRHQDTSRNLAGLSDVLARLRAPADARSSFNRRAPSSAPAVLQDDGSERGNGRKYASAPSRLSRSTAVRPRLATLGERSANTGGLASMMSAASGTFLKGVIAYVDVYTTEGDEAGGTFVEMLKRCGARVLVKKPTEQCTHIIYKTGRPATANFVRRLDADKRPKVVGIRWVTRCAEQRAWVPEDEFTVNLDSEDVFAAKKKSMQPKVVGRGGLSGGLSGGLGGLSGGGGLGAKPSTVVRAVPRTNIYAPKVGSPLKKSYVHRDEN